MVFCNRFAFGTLLEIDVTKEKARFFGPTDIKDGNDLCTFGKENRFNRLETNLLRF